MTIIDELIGVFVDDAISEAINQPTENDYQCDFTDFQGDPASIIKSIADGINKKSIQHCEIDESIPNFYKIQTDTKLSDFIQKNINTNWLDLEENAIWAVGTHLHDLEADGITIHDKIQNIRHAIIWKSLRLNQITECIPDYNAEADTLEKVEKIINLGEMKFDEYDLKIECEKPTENGKASAKRVVNKVLKILNDKNWITGTQSTALRMQFKFVDARTSLPQNISKMFRKYKQTGIPKVSDFTAQCLFWELSRWICFNPKQIIPQIHKLFNGPLFHFLCDVQRKDAQWIMGELNTITCGLTGTVVKYAYQKAYGFIRRDEDEPDVFVHQGDIRGKLRTLRLGDRVKFDMVVQDDGRQKAVNVVVLEHASNNYHNRGYGGRRGGHGGGYDDGYHGGYQGGYSRKRGSRWQIKGNENQQN